MALDPEFVRKIQERKAAREALEQKYGKKQALPKSSGSSGRKAPSAGGTRKAGPVYRSVSLLNGDSVIIDGEEARKRVEKAKYRG